MLAWMERHIEFAGTLKDCLVQILYFLEDGNKL